MTEDAAPAQGGRLRQAAAWIGPKNPPASGGNSLQRRGLLPAECGCYRARVELPSVEFPVWRCPRREQFIRGPAGEIISPRPVKFSFRSAQTSTATEGASMADLEIMWTKVDEAPALATYSLLPIVEAFVGAAGVSVEAQRHLAGRSHPRHFPREAHSRATDQRRTHRTRRTRDAARSQHHEAAEHLRLDPAAQGRDQGTAGQGLRRSGLSG